MARNLLGFVLPMHLLFPSLRDDLHHPHLLRGWPLHHVPDVLYQRDVQHDVFLRH